MTLEQFIARWTASGDAERANKDSFLNELCDVLGVERPHPKTGDPQRDLYVFEKNVVQAKSIGATTTFVDLYKDGCFLLEAKQRATAGPKKRDSPAWNLMMADAHGQALGYASSLASPPPFLLVCDIGYCFDVYASFDGNGIYRAFPDGLRKRVLLRDLATKPDQVELLRAIWTYPRTLDPSQRAAKVTRDVAEQIAVLARALEAAGQNPEVVATFLMRCLFTMFAEDVGLLPDKLFSHALEHWWLPSPESFPSGVASLWQAMNTGSNYVTGKLLRFNGGLFSTHMAPALTRDQLILLLMAAKSDWSEVDPSIFGTLLERALNPKERHRLGAHYTPRAYVERLVKPTIEEPLRGDWDLVRAEVRELVAAGRIDSAQERVLTFHHSLCRTRVLDPACGTGNFLYVTLDVFKRLESEVLTLLSELGYKQIGLEMETYRVTPEQFLGIEVKRWAKEIAELVLWIGYLQWQVRQAGGTLTIPEPVLRDYGNIQCRDAVLAYDREELLLDDSGKLVTRWDGETMKTSPVTGELIPDDQARMPVYRYLKPRQAKWPDAEFIVGNPPFLGKLYALERLGEGYTAALRSAYEGAVPDGCDLVMYWWHCAARIVAAGRSRRFGLISTNSIRQAMNRRVVGDALDAPNPIHLVFAIPDHPWVDSTEGAQVRIAMTVGAPGPGGGILASIQTETLLPSGESEVSLVLKSGRIHADLRTGPDVAAAVALTANSAIAGTGLILGNRGFVLTMAERNDLIARDPKSELLIAPLMNGNDVVDVPRGVFVLDSTEWTEERLRSEAPGAYQWLRDRVYPERQQNRDPRLRAEWWRFRRSNEQVRAAILDLPRYIVTSETARHRVFIFLGAQVKPEHKLVVIGTADAAILGVLSSRAHVTWALRAGGNLGVGNDPVYSKTRCFDPFPFPTCSEDQTPRIRILGEVLDSHRKRQQALFPKLMISDMYHVLEKLRSGEPLNEKELAIHERGLISVLKEIHDDLDAAVFGAYGWPATLTDEEILERLVTLNHERAEEEKRGLIRWLRPDFQNPQGATVATQGSLVEVGLEATPAKAGKAKKGTKISWPKELPARVVAARDLLAERGEVTLIDFAERFKGIKAADAEKVLDSLAAVGVAVETRDLRDRRAWRLLQRP